MSEVRLGQIKGSPASHSDSRAQRTGYPTRWSRLGMSPDPKGIWITRQIEALSGPLEETWDLCDLYVDVREETGPLRFLLAVTPEPSQPSPMGLIPWAPELEVPQIARSVLSFDAGPSPVTPLLETPRWRQGPSNKGSFGCLAPSVPTGPHPLVVSLALFPWALSPPGLCPCSALGQRVFPQKLI